MDIIPKVGDWVTLKTEYGIDSNAGKVLKVDHARNIFYGQFFTEDDDGPSLEAEEWFFFSQIARVINDPRIIKEQDGDYRKACGI